MDFRVGEVTYPVVIEKKKTTKNLYIRIREDLTVYITCNVWMTDSAIQKFLLENEEKIKKMILRKQTQEEEKKAFYFLGKKYDVVYTEQVFFQLGEEKVFLSRNFPVEKWFKKQALVLFKKRLDTCYQNFSRTIPYPSLRIRKMKTRWGVCNVRDKIVTLNLELIRKDIAYLDYVIYHELSHLIYPNHSKAFWHLVEENCKEYKRYRKELNA